MSNTIIGEFSVLSPSQKRELEHKRKENEARKTAEAARRSEAARKAREAAKLAKEKRLAVIRAENAAQESKKNILKLWIVVLYILIIVVIWLVFHYYNVSFDAIYRDQFGDLSSKIAYGILYFPFAGGAAALIIAGIVAGIEALKDKIKKMQ